MTKRCRSAYSSGSCCCSLLTTDIFVGHIDIHFCLWVSVFVHCVWFQIRWKLYLNEDEKWERVLQWDIKGWIVLFFLPSLQHEHQHIFVIIQTCNHRLKNTFLCLIQINKYRFPRIRDKKQKPVTTDIYWVSFQFNRH